MVERILVIVRSEKDFTVSNTTNKIVRMMVFKYLRLFFLCSLSMC